MGYIQLFHSSQGLGQQAGHLLRIGCGVTFWHNLQFLYDEVIKFLLIGENTTDMFSECHELRFARIWQSPQVSGIDLRMSVELTE